jgi:hypothetical protein
MHCGGRGARVQGFVSIAFGDYYSLFDSTDTAWFGTWSVPVLNGVDAGVFRQKKMSSVDLLSI